MQKKFHKKAFTLIEMLIVIVIIGVLAAALIPRLTSVRDRANDVARKADLNQIATAVIARQMDHNGNLPGVGLGAISVSGIAQELKDAGLDSIPTDPKAVTRVSGLSGNDVQSAPAQYGYMTIRKNGIQNGAFVVMAKMETPGASNWLYNSGSTPTGLITGDDDSSILIPCKSMTKTGVAGSMLLNPGGDCFFKSLDELRFMIIR